MMRSKGTTIRGNLLLIVLLVYAAASLFHHVHNAEFLDEYPNLPAWLTPALVYGAWGGVTAVGLIGYFLVRFGYQIAGLAVLSAYGALGLYGLGHYVVAPLSAHTSTMNLSILLEVAAAVLLIAAVIGRMRWLELKIPPPVVALLAAGAMWEISRFAPLLELPSFIRIAAAAASALAGVGFSLAGVISFRRAKTTVNPMKPEKASALVCSGIYRLTRNPMYVGLAFILVAWAVFLSSAWALLGPLAFVLYMNRFQIAPEEKVLASLFGAGYADYRSGVRRWL